MEIRKAPEQIWAEYRDGVLFNQQIELEANVRINNNFYNDRQWLGVNAPDLDKPCLNIIKPAVNYYVSQLVSDDIGVSIELAELSGDAPSAGESAALSPGAYVAKIMQEAVNDVLESTEAAYKHRLLLKRMALDGDMVLYSWFDPDAGGDQQTGMIRTEIINNTDIFFGDPSTPEVEVQPWIIIRQRRPVAAVREECRKDGGDFGSINADNEAAVETEDVSKQYVTVLTKFYKEGGMVWFIKCTDSVIVRKATNLGYKLYPVAYACWEQERNSYHGVSPVTGKINNQIIINKLYALASLDRQNFSFPKIIYDRSKLPDGWNSTPGKAVAVSGDPRQAVFADFRPGDMSGQVLQLIGDLDERTKASMGIYDTALGNARPDNTSAILAIQQAAATPLDLQRLDFHRFVESCVRIWLDMMSVDYGVRTVRLPMPLADGSEAVVPTEFDFAQLGGYQWHLKVEIGAAAYWSELLQVQMMDSLLSAGVLPDKLTYLECLPEGYLKNRNLIMDRVREQEKNEAAALMNNEVTSLMKSPVG